MQCHHILILLFFYYRIGIPSEANGVAQITEVGYFESSKIIPSESDHGALAEEISNRITT
ncbi:MAG: hypothetical protein Q9M76_06070 [Candidatus Dojkabacteria bacterium]|nr:hypothetical protein [Candidatus Dojkabacteria bacterium]